MKEAALASALILLAGAFALPIVKSINMGWIRLVSLLLPEDERGRWREEAEGDLIDTITHYLGIGYRPVEAALLVLVRMVFGLRDNAGYALPYVLESLPNGLARGRESLRDRGNLTVAIASVAILGWMNVVYFSSERAGLIDGIVFNVLGIPLIVMMRYQHVQWVRGVLYCGIGLMAVMAAIVIGWVILEYRPYEVSGFYSGVVALLSVILGTVVAFKESRDRFFKGHWWPVLVCWGVILATAIGVSKMLLGSTTFLFTTWLYVILHLATLIFIAFAAWVIGLCCIAIWLGGTHVVAGGKSLAAVCIRRLK